MFPDVLTPNPAILQFAVLGANGQPNTAGWDDDFEDGTVYTLEYSQPSNFFNLPGRHLFGGGYSNRDFALLDQNPNPTDAEIREGMEGALCRCMTYYRVQAAIKRVAAGTQSGGPDADQEVVR